MCAWRLGWSVVVVGENGSPWAASLGAGAGRRRAVGRPARRTLPAQLHLARQRSPPRRRAPWAQQPARPSCLTPPAHRRPTPHTNTHAHCRAVRVPGRHRPPLPAPAARGGPRHRRPLPHRRLAPPRGPGGGRGQRDRGGGKCVCGGWFTSCCVCMCICVREKGREREYVCAWWWRWGETSPPHTHTPPPPPDPPLPLAQINSYLHLNGQNRLRQRTYSVGHHVRYGYRFLPIVRHPSQSRWGWGGGVGGGWQGGVLPGGGSRGGVWWGGGGVCAWVVDWRAVCASGLRAVGLREGFSGPGQGREAGSGNTPTALEGRTPTGAQPLKAQTHAHNLAPTH